MISGFIKKEWIDTGATDPPFLKWCDYEIVDL